MSDEDEARSEVDLLCARIGMIMEDGSAEALIGPLAPEADQRLARLEQAGRDIVILASAANVLQRRWNVTDKY